MTDSGAAHRIIGSDILARAARVRSRVDWARLGVGAKGFLLTIATAIVFDQLARHGMPVVHPFAFLLLTVVYSTYTGGLRWGIGSAVVSLLYARHYLAEPGFVLRYTPENAYTLLGFLLIFPLTVFLVARMRDAAERARALEFSRAERRSGWIAGSPSLPRQT